MSTPCTCDIVANFFQSHNLEYGNNKSWQSDYYIIALDCEKSIRNIASDAIKSCGFKFLKVATNTFCVYLPISDPMYFLAKVIVCACESAGETVNSHYNKLFIMRLDASTCYRFPDVPSTCTPKAFTFDEINNYYLRK